MTDILAEDIKNNNKALQFELEVKNILELFQEKESETNWRNFERALIRLIEKTQYISGIKSLKQPIQNSILTERTKLSGTATELVEEISKSLGPNFDSLAKLFVPNILKLCNRTNKLFGTRAYKCSETIIKVSKLSSLIPKFREAMQSQSKLLKTNVAKLTLTILEEDITGLENHIVDLEWIIHLGVIDSTLEVRTASKKSFEVYKSRFSSRKNLGIINKAQPTKFSHQPICRNLQNHKDNGHDDDIVIFTNNEKKQQNDDDSFSTDISLPL
ncbi:5996_t:CDS:2 [Entrophospora sp. SA101]|nr:2991_t:CDS:2 [Entrophospora sp. SA101]CAJ0758562.1 5996_t:CDS:2 [Entrophospora sp. SA101]